jgi:amidase
MDMMTALERREVSARELLSDHLDVVATHNPELNAVVTLAAERAADEAATVDERRAAGESLGPLAGLPITIKDALQTAGIRSTGGAPELAENVPDGDAPAVARLRDAGAVIFGKTNLPCWSGDVQTFNELFGTTNNPWDLTRTPGGSSGGAAAAVATGMSPFELGTDIGGSVRIPASNCGLFGHNPTFGIIPTLGYLDHPEGGDTEADVNVFGPLTRSVDDLEMVFDLLTGPIEPAARGWTLDLPPTAASELGDFRIAAWLDDPFCPVEPDVRAVHERALERLEAAGARIELARPGFDARAMTDAGGLLISAAASPVLSPAEVAEEEADGRLLTQVEWHRLNRIRIEGRRRWASFFDGFDVVLCPVLPVAPIVHQQPPPGGSNWGDPLTGQDRRYRDLIGWTALVGSAYLPSTVAPLGLTDAGLPVGVQIVGSFLSDRTTIAFARAIEEAVGGFTPPPNFAPD